jgi:hypothetical protein
MVTQGLHHRLGRGHSRRARHPTGALSVAVTALAVASAEHVLSHGVESDLGGRDSDPLARSSSACCS